MLTSMTLPLSLDAEHLSSIPIPITVLPFRSVNPVAERTLLPTSIEGGDVKHPDGVSPTNISREEHASSASSTRPESSSPSLSTYSVNAGTGDLGIFYELVIKDVPASVLDDLATAPPCTIANESFNLAAAISTSTPIPHGQDLHSQMSESQSTRHESTPGDSYHYPPPPHVPSPQSEAQADNLTSPSMSTSSIPAAAAGDDDDAQHTRIRIQGDGEDSGFQSQSMPEHGRDMKPVSVPFIYSPSSLLQTQTQSSSNSASTSPRKGTSSNLATGQTSISTPHAATQDNGQLQASVDSDHSSSPVTERTSIPHTTHITHTRNPNFRSSMSSQPEHDQDDPSRQRQPQNQSQARRRTPEVYYQDLCLPGPSHRPPGLPPREASHRPRQRSPMPSYGKRRAREEDDEWDGGRQRRYGGGRKTRKFYH